MAPTRQDQKTRVRKLNATRHFAGDGREETVSLPPRPHSRPESARVRPKGEVDRIHLTQFTAPIVQKPALAPAATDSASAPSPPPAPSAAESGADGDSVKPLPFPVSANDAANSTRDASSDTATESDEDRYPLNLATALQLAGGSNLQIALATERVQQAVARLDGAEVLWIPSLNFGVGYNTHVGRLQATDGTIVDVNRESVFVGGGPSLSGAPQTGASGGPARLFVDISPADIYFEPLAARQAQTAALADESATFNDTLLQVTVTWLELLQAQSELAIIDEAVHESEKLVRITSDFSKTGAGLEADARRARADLADRRRQRFAAEERIAVVSAELARQLRLPPEVQLVATDSQPAPLELISEETDLSQLVAQAVSSRPELMRETARVEEAERRVQQERWRPWLPNIHLGLSTGGFGGGPNDTFGSFSDKTDFDALAIWQLRNFGLGNEALQDERDSQHRQAYLAWEQMQDRVEAEVTASWKQVQLRRRQIDQAAEAVKSAAGAVPLNFEGIRGRELRPIEAQQAIAALADARREYLSAVVQYNQSQFALLRSIGQTPGMSADSARTQGEQG